MSHASASNFRVLKTIATIAHPLLFPIAFPVRLTFINIAFLALIQLFVVTILAVVEVIKSLEAQAGVASFAAFHVQCVTALIIVPTGRTVKPFRARVRPYNVRAGAKLFPFPLRTPRAGDPHERVGPKPSDQGSFSLESFLNMAFF